LKLTKCAPISGLPEIGFFMRAQVGQTRLAMRETAPGFLLSMEIDLIEPTGFAERSDPSGPAGAAWLPRHRT
jgi:hypothetical protein